MESVQLNSKNAINFSSIIHVQGPCQEETLKKCSKDILAMVDKNNDEKISQNELKMFLGVTTEDA